MTHCMVSLLALFHVSKLVNHFIHIVNLQKTLKKYEHMQWAIHAKTRNTAHIMVHE